MLTNVAADNFRRFSENRYPGRVIVIGKLSGDYEIQVYALTGRSENSRNRKFVHEGGIVKTTPIDPAKVKDPSLIIYKAMRETAGIHIVTNGKQTDTIYECTQRSSNGFESAMRKETFEPDLPNYTPRISAMSGHGRVQFGTHTRSPDGRCERTVYEYDEIPQGYGYCLHTYAGDGDPLPAFTERPYLVPLGGDSIESVANYFWSALNRDNRVALVAKQIDISLDKVKVHII